MAEEDGEPVSKDYGKDQAPCLNWNATINFEALVDEANNH